MWRIPWPAGWRRRAELQARLPCCWTSTCPTGTGVSAAGAFDGRCRARVHAGRGRVGRRAGRFGRARVRAQGRARVAAARRTLGAAMRVVIGEDQALLRQGIVRLLGDAGFDVVAEAGDAPDLLRKVAAHKPDVAIVDVQMPPDNTDDGLRAAMEIRASQPDVGVLVLSPVRRGALRGRPDRRQRRGRRLPAQGPRDGLQGFAEAVRRVGAAGRCSTRRSSRTCSAGAAATTRSRS